MSVFVSGSIAESNSFLFQMSRKVEIQGHGELLLHRASTTNSARAQIDLKKSETEMTRLVVNFKSKPRIRINTCLATFGDRLMKDAADN